MADPLGGDVSVKPAAFVKVIKTIDAERVTR